VKNGLEIRKSAIGENVERIDKIEWPGVPGLAWATLNIREEKYRGETLNDLDCELASQPD